jgi:hypothetical protein
MGSADEEAVAVAMKAVLAYLRAHPRARDTACGILQWWLPRTSAIQLSQVEEALERLVEAEMIRSKTVPGGAVVYGDGELDE